MIKFNLAVVLAVALIVVGFAYALNRGFYVGSSIEYRDNFHHLICHYLFPSGIREVDTGGWISPQEAKRNRECRLFLR
jgi:hypothetical protein